MADEEGQDVVSLSDPMCSLDITTVGLEREVQLGSKIHKNESLYLKIESVNSVIATRTIDLAIEEGIL